MFLPQQQQKKEIDEHIVSNFSSFCFFISVDLDLKHFLNLQREDGTPAILIKLHQPCL